MGIFIFKNLYSDVHTQKHKQDLFIILHILLII